MQLLYLVNDTLDFYQIKTGKFTQSLSTFKLKEMIEKCFELVDI